MGGRGSRPISFEDAQRRVAPEELAKIRQAFHRLSSNAGAGPISKQVFLAEVLGDSVPPVLAERLYHVLGGSASKGMSFKDFLCGRAIFNTATADERLRVVFDVYDLEGSGVLDGHSVQQTVAAEQCHVEQLRPLSEWLRKCPSPNYEAFRAWAHEHHTATRLISWAFDTRFVAPIGLGPPGTASVAPITMGDDIDDDFADNGSDNAHVARSSASSALSASSSSLNALVIETQHEALCSSTRFSSAAVRALEQKYFELSLHAGRVGRLTRAVVRDLMEPPLSATLINCIFDVLDIESLGSLSFVDLVCGLSTFAQGTHDDKLAFTFNLFDAKGDQRLSRAELRTLLESLWDLDDTTKNSDDDKESTATAESCVVDAFAEFDSHSTGYLNRDQFLQWARSQPRVASALRTVWLVAHASLGLHPASRADEGDVVRRWLNDGTRHEPPRREHWYIVNRDWWHRWCVFVNFDDSNTQAAAAIQQPPGPITNEQICQVVRTTGTVNVGVPTAQGICYSMFGPTLRSNLTLDVDVVAVPPRVWKALSSWYGGGPVVPRPLLAPCPRQDVSRAVPPVDLYPPTVAVFVAPVARAPAFLLVVDRGITVTHLLEYILAKHRREVAPARVGVLTAADDVRLWLLPGPVGHVVGTQDRPGNLLAPSASLSASGIDDNARVYVEVRSHSGAWPTSIVDLSSSSSSSSPSALAMPSSTPASTAAATPSTIVSTTRAPAVTPGCTGLANLGNTCFLNSAVQSICHAPPFVTYFRRQLHSYEYNLNNPMGMNGHIAMEFGELCNSLWSGSQVCVTPARMRSTIIRYASQFAGTEQHDPQELMSFLLDGLHEDLNRVTVKPYKELADSDGRPDDQVAAEWWENHTARNRSIVVDCFHGQLRSRVRCNECDFENVTFDPFTFLTLPLPVDLDVFLEAVIVHLPDDNTRPVPMRYSVRCAFRDTYAQFCESLAKLCDLSASHLLVAEVSSARVFRYISLDRTVQPTFGSPLYVYQLPSVAAAPATAASAATQTASVPPTEPVPAAVNCSVIAQQPTGQKSDPAAAMTPPLPGGGESGDNGGAPTAASDLFVTVPRKGNKGLLHNVTHLFKSSASSTTTANNTITNSATAPKGVGSTSTIMQGHPRMPRAPVSDTITCVHRTVSRQPAHYLHPVHTILFGLPIVLHVGSLRTPADLYVAVWSYVRRFVRPPMRTSPSMPDTHPFPSDASASVLTQVYSAERPPFILRLVDATGHRCAVCSWERRCNGCGLSAQDTTSALKLTSGFIAIDWHTRAFHLRYSSALEKHTVDHELVAIHLKEQGEAITLNQCLDAFMKDEQLGEDEVWRCPKCADFRRPFKQMTLWKLPPVLIIQLKRFQLVHGRWVKAQKKIAFPSTGLALAHGNAAESTETVYDLSSVVHHTGIMGGGHCTTQARVDGDWKMFNDSRVMDCDPPGLTPAQLARLSFDGNATLTDSSDSTESLSALASSAAYVLCYTAHAADIDALMPVLDDTAEVRKVPTSDGRRSANNSNCVVQ